MAAGAATGSTERGYAGRPVDQLSAAELNSEVDTLGRAYTRDTKNKAVAMRYAAVLQMNGRNEQSLAVMRKLAIDLPKDREVLASYGKSLAAAGIARADFEAALPELARAAFEDPSLRTNPRMPLLREIVELLEAAWRGR